jgi:hypothetical protein
MLRRFRYLLPEYDKELAEVAKIMTLYRDEKGTAKVSVRFSEEDLWLTQKQIALIYETTKQNISLHIKNILADSELGEDSAIKHFLTSVADTKNYNTTYYNLDMMIALGYRIRSQIAMRFRLFFENVQDKLHFAVHEHTAAELIYERVDHKKPLVGMTKFKGEHVTRDNIKIAKNYLSELELQQLNLLMVQFFDIAGLQSLEQTPMTTNNWIAALDNQILALKMKPFTGSSKISRKEAFEKAEREFELYHARETK